MPNFASLTIAGHLGKDPVIRVTPSGDSVTSFSVEVNRKRGDAQTVTWWNCTLWGKRGEAVARFLKKGDPILATGEPREEPWTRTAVSARACASMCGISRS